MTFLLARMKGRSDPRCYKETVSWILERDGWFTPAWTSLTYYSDSDKLIRFRNDFDIQLPKAQWPFKLPKLYKFELTAHADELSGTVLEEIVVYAELARTASKGQFDRHPPRFCFGGDAGHYGWTEKAWQFENERKK